MRGENCAGNVVIEIRAMASRTASAAEMTGKRRPVLHARDGAVAFHSGKMQQHCEPRGAFHQSADRRSAQADDQVTFPVSGYGPISCFRRSFTDHGLRRDEGFAPPAATCPRHAQCPSPCEGRRSAHDGVRRGPVRRSPDRSPMSDSEDAIMALASIPTTVPDDAWPLDHFHGAASRSCTPQRLIRCQLDGFGRRIDQHPGSGHRLRRIRMARVEDASAESLIPFVQTAVCPGATIRTDGWRAYNGLTGVGFEPVPAEKYFRQRRPSPHCHAPSSSGSRPP